MRRVVLPVLASVALLTPSLTLAQVSDLKARFTFVGTSARDAAALLDEIAGCAAETDAFAAIIAGIPDSAPLVTHAAAHLPRTLFAASYDGESRAPRLSVSLAAIERLPTASDARTWAGDSSWAFTRCEVLAHEVAESILYRALWVMSPQNEDGANVAGFSTRFRAAHRAGLDAEAAVGVAQGIRVTAAGRPYVRSRECFEGGAIHVVFGSNTQTLFLRHGAVAMAFHPGTDLCPVPRLRPARVTTR